MVRAIGPVLRRLWLSSSGGSTVELAIIIPAMLLFMFGTIEFGRFYWTQNVLQYAVEQTARKSLPTTPAITDCSTSVANSAAVTANLTGIPADSVTVTLTSLTNTASFISPAPKSCKILITTSFSFLGVLDLPMVQAVGVAAFPCGSNTTCS
jgi:Flp pilus assembly protein TadG